MATVELPHNIGYGSTWQSTLLGGRILLGLNARQMAAAFGVSTREYNTWEREGRIPKNGNLWVSNALRDMIAEELAFPQAPGFEPLAQRFSHLR